MKRLTQLILASACLITLTDGAAAAEARALEAGFARPPAENRPWVYWYFMDGNLTREGITADLEAMRDAGIGGAIFLEVNIGVPQGPVKFMSAEWRRLVAHAVREAERLGIEIALGSGPGWCGTGGPWVKAEQSMQHLVASETSVSGPAKFDAELARPQPVPPFFGLGTLTPESERQWREFYRDVAVLAFPQPKDVRRLTDVEEKAIYRRAPYSSSPGVKSSLPTAADFPDWPHEARIRSGEIVDLSGKMSADGRLRWDVPQGAWTIMRFCRTATGQITRPAPEPGLGFETDKFDPSAVDAHLEHFVGSLLKEIGPRKAGAGGLSTLHFDSWEMSSQNWSKDFRDEFKGRRGYDPLQFLPAYRGFVVDNVEVTERFLWDVRQTAQELTIANHVSRLRDFAHQHGLKYSSEPYDMNPNADLTMGGVADVPMGEFWWLGFDTAYSVIEAASVAHTNGRTVVAAEAFTSEPGEDWKGYPGNIKSLGDWAFAAGINRIAFHRYQHQPWLDRWPGMRMGPYGVHWERTQTWWPMVSAYHTYLARCQFLLRQGTPVADILYLAAEGAPHVFRAPPSATRGNPPDRREHNFDGCAPETLIARASVENGCIAFPDGARYQVLVLPDVETMTPVLLRKLGELIAAGATVVGPPPRKSPSLVGYPQCDEEVQQLAKVLWAPPRESGKRNVVWGGEFAQSPEVDKPVSDPLEGAKWIWIDEGNASLDAPVGARYFRRSFAIPDDAAIEAATVLMTADNSFTLSVNGREVGKGDNFHQVPDFRVEEFLRNGNNELSVLASNGGDSPNPAGLAATVEVKLRGGERLRWQTDRNWLASRRPGAEEEPARELGPVGMAPWGKPNKTSETQLRSTRYPDYESVARMIESSGCAPDFESDGPVRYIHRSAGEVDIYFVANRTDNPVDARCVFRAAGKKPELWHPVTGDRRELPSFAINKGRTTVPLRFEPAEAYFILFRNPASSQDHVADNFASAKTLLDVTGPWQVTFDPKWGAPEQAPFATLEDWTSRSEPGIKFYSGRATYRKTFELPQEASQHAASRLFLTLGEVRNVARVSLNGRDLGAVWCAPWRVEITDAAKAGPNSLEITVANLWINRLIGDAGLPAEKRLTWTTANPFRPDSPLSPSGLIGPVTVEREAIR